jgi:hypothetical protein
MEKGQEIWYMEFKETIEVRCTYNSNQRNRKIEIRFSRWLGGKRGAL